MQGEFKQCPNGHYYQGDTCPYCKSTKNSSVQTKTEIFITEGVTGGPTGGATGGATGGTQTTVQSGVSSGGTLTEVESGKGTTPTYQNCTMFGEDTTEEITLDGSSVSASQGRYARKLVGWLVTYTLDELGVSFNIYEGRNMIGRDMDSNITVNDPRMSGKHALILFRAGKYSITDQQSSHGTFVNDKDIELDPQYLQDGDIIKMGSTIFKFRSSL